MPSESTDDRSILVIDESPDVRRALERLLDRRGYRVRSAASCDEAAEILEKDGHGLELLLVDAATSPPSRRLARNEAEPHPKILFMAASGSGLGATTVRPLLLKPFGADELYRAIDRLWPRQEEGTGAAARPTLPSRR